MLAEATAHLIRGIVDHPDDVEVRTRSMRGPGGGLLLMVEVHPDDMGRVIGRSGRTATAVRKVVNAVGDGKSVRIDFLDASDR